MKGAAWIYVRYADAIPYFYRLNFDKRQYKKYEKIAGTLTELI